jgi:hypothetical protein
VKLPEHTRKGEEVTLDLSFRPVRLASLVADRTELATAIELYSHIWGGAANIILPIPKTEVQDETLGLLLRQADPDYILLYGEHDLSRTKSLDKSPAELHLMSRKRVSSFAERHEYLTLGVQGLVHIGRVLNATVGHGARALHMLVPPGRPNWRSALLFGLPSGAHKTYLRDTHLVSEPRPPDDQIGDWVLANLAQRVNTPIRATMVASSPSHDLIGNLEPMANINGDVIHIFVDDGVTLQAPCALWNSVLGRPPYGAVMVVIPEKRFVSDPSLLLKLCLEDSPETRGFSIVMEADKEESERVLSTVVQSLSDLGSHATAQVTYDNASFTSSGFKPVSELRHSVTSTIGVDGGVTFPVQAPKGHDQALDAFGFDGIVRYWSGRSFSLPATPEMARLLTNEEWRIARAESSGEQGTLWLRNTTLTRPSARGIAGTVRSGSEGEFCIHGPDRLVGEFLKSKGYRLRANTLSRYTTGFARRLGGLDAALEFARTDGMALLRARAHYVESRPDGLVANQLVELVRARLKVDRAHACNVVTQTLPELLEDGVVRRGALLRCPSCDLRAWYNVTDIREKMLCLGCMDEFQLPTKPMEFAYTLNELTRRFVVAGGPAVLMTAAAVYRVDHGMTLQFGGDLCAGETDNPDSEVDIIGISHEVIMIGECKMEYVLTADAVSRSIESLKKCVEVAKRMSADVVLFGVSTAGDPAGLKEAMRPICSESRDAGLAVHLVLNGTFHDGVESLDDLENLLPLANRVVERTKKEWKQSVGKLPDELDIAPARFAVRDETILSWLAEHATTPTPPLLAHYDGSVYGSLTLGEKALLPSKD